MVSKEDYANLFKPTPLAYLTNIEIDSESDHDVIFSEENPLVMPSTGYLRVAVVVKEGRGATLWMYVFNEVFPPQNNMTYELFHFDEDTMYVRDLLVREGDCVYFEVGYDVGRNPAIAIFDLSLINTLGALQW